MTDVEVFVDPSCPWAWITSRWVLEVAPGRDLAVYWRSYCLEIRDDYDVAPTVPEDFWQRALDGHALSHRMLRIFEAARATAGEDMVGHLYTEWGRRFFLPERLDAGNLLADCIAASGLDATLIEAADDEKWDAPIRDAMEVAYAFGGPKTQTPTIVVRADPSHGFKGPVMAPAPQGDDALRLWDAIQVLSEYQGFFEISRPAPTLPGWNYLSRRSVVASSAATLTTRVPLDVLFLASSIRAGPSGPGVGLDEDAVGAYRPGLDQAELQSTNALGK